MKWLLIPMALLLVLVGARLFSGSDAAPGKQDVPGQLTPEEMKALGIAGDTPRDTVATLVAQVKQLRTELQTALSDNRQHKAENERLRTREGAIDQRIQNALDSERRRLEQERTQAASDRRSRKRASRPNSASVKLCSTVTWNPSAPSSQSQSRSSSNR